MNRDTTSRLPSCRSTTGSCNWELQALYTQNVLYAKLGELNCSVKKANTSLTGAEKGHLFRWRHQLAHNCQGPSYLFWVLVRHDDNKILHTSGERPVFHSGCITCGCITCGPGLNGRSSVLSATGNGAGKCTSISSRAGYQGYPGHVGAITSPVVWSWRIFRRIFGNSTIGEWINTVHWFQFWRKASVAMEPESGYLAT